MLTQDIIIANNLNMKIENVLLILGLVFSTFLITFQIGEGFELLNIKWKFTLVEIGLYQSNKTYLNSAIFGNLCYLIFSFIMWKQGNRKGLILTLIMLTLISIGFQFKAFYESFYGVYSGTHFQIGALLAFIGFKILDRINKVEKNLKIHKDF